MQKLCRIRQVPLVTLLWQGIAYNSLLKRDIYIYVLMILSLRLLAVIILSSLQMYKAIKQGKKEFKLADKGAEAVRKLVKTGGTSVASAEGTTHSFTEEEKFAFVDWINYLLVDDADLKDILPMNEEDDSLFEGVGNGILLW